MGQPYFDFGELSSIMAVNTYRFLVSEFVRPTVEEVSSVSDVANIMAEHGVSCVVAILKGKVLGILTEKDLLKIAIKT